MTDRELLEAAAKAAGITGDWCRWHQAYGDEWVEGIDIGGRFLWNPLMDDGDALRLAVKLELDFFNSCISVRSLHRSSDRGWTIRCRGGNPQMDAYAAARQTIVRAAAMIGESK